MPKTVEIGEQDAREAVRWISIVQIEDKAKLAFLIHPPARVTFRIGQIQPHTIFRAFVAMLPEAWERNIGGVQFRVDVMSVNGGTKHLSRQVNPTSIHKHRRWLELQLDLQHFMNREVDLALATSVPDGVSTEYAEAVWGDPVLLSRKPFREIMGRGKRFFKLYGVKGLWSKVTRTPEPQASFRSTEQVITSQPSQASDWIVQGELAFGDEDLWGEYNTLSRRISKWRQKRIESITPKLPNMISIKDDQLYAIAKSLRFAAVNKPDASIIIPAYNNIKLTVECLKTISQNTHNVSYEILVVDDGSTDTTQEILSSVQNIICIKNPVNLGFNGSCNRAAGIARGEYLVFLNNDVQVEDNWLSSLLESFTKFDCVGAVGPRVIYPDGRLQEAGVIVNEDASTKLVGFFDDPEMSKYQYIREVDYCSGTCLVVPKQVFLEIGGFDSRYAPAYYEDADLCFEIRSRGMHILYNPNATIVHHLSATLNSTTVSYKMELVMHNQQKLLEKWHQQISELNHIRLIAFYLPQYHPIPENDLWWGKGFTEWHNVVKARPNFIGHYQPHLPADLGFYDLRVEKIMEEQAELAKRYGLYGFCFYYYWFNGKRLLQMPLERMLESGRSTIPFCLCWANENWTRKWDGHEDHVLIKQHYSGEDDCALIRDLMRFMRHPNYIRVNGKPLVLVYRVDLLPNSNQTALRWRDLCHKEGVGEIYLCMAESFNFARKSENPSQYGFDASVEFPPHEMFDPGEVPGQIINPYFTGKVSDYREVALKYLQKETPGYVRFRSVIPGWDNTPRRQNDPYIFANASPGSYQAWLESVIDVTREQNFGDERIIFINSWNEWAEGAYLEPDQRSGHAFLEATRNALDATLLKRA